MSASCGGLSSGSPPVIERLENRQFFSTVIGLDKGKTLIVVDSASPSEVLAKIPVRGLLNKETIAAIEFRPSTGQLYGLSSTNRLYLIDPSTGQANSAVTPGDPLASAPAGADFGFDVVPDTSEIRVLSGANVHTLYGVSGAGALTVTTKTGPTYADADVNAGATPDIVAIAHDNNTTGSDPATLFAIDRANNTLVRVGSEGGDPQSPDTGLLSTVAPIGPGTITGPVGFDILTNPTNGAETAFVTFFNGPKARSGLFTADLTTGATTALGEIGKARRPMTDIAVVPTGTPIIVATARQLVVVDSNLPAVAISQSPKITGLAAKDKLTFIDRRPSTGEIYGYSRQLRLYTINPSTGVATQVGQTTGLSFDRRAQFAGDIDPVRDTMRIVSTFGDNFRINLSDASIIDTDPVTAEIQPDVNLEYGVGDPNQGTFPTITGIAYTQAIPGASFTAPFGIDEGLDVLTTISSPDGELNTTANLFTLGSLGMDVIDLLGFDITTTADGVTNTGYIVSRRSGGFFLTTVDLNNGATSHDLKLGKGIKPISMATAN